MLPIIALTAYSFTREKQKALDAGCEIVLSKPINQKVLFKALARYL